ncbi:MAG: thioredoxin family protein [Bacteroidota bacterium]
MRIIPIYIIFFCLLISSSCKDRRTIISEVDLSVDTSKINFKYAAFDDVIKQAEEESKDIFVYVTSTSCGHCYRMERDVFTQDAVQKFYNEKFVCAKVQIEHPGGITKASVFEELNKTKINFLDLYDVELVFPTFLIVDQQGALIKKVTKTMEAQEFVQFGNGSVERDA